MIETALIIEAMLIPIMSILFLSLIHIYMFSHRHIEKVCEPNIPDKEPDDKLIHETVMIYAPDDGENITFD